jgi:hypothetical protein
MGSNNEFIWKPEGLGNKYGIFTHMLNGHYTPPGPLDLAPWNRNRCAENLPATEEQVKDW